VITYSDYDKAYADAQRTYTSLAARYNALPNRTANVSFRLAVGSYDDVLDWYRNGFINVAVLSPGPVAALLLAPGADQQRIRELYVGTVNLTPVSAGNDFAAAERHYGKEQVQYHSVCVVNRDAPIKNWEQLKQGIEKNEVELLFVDPLSASGRILPEYVLRKLSGIETEALNKNLLDAKWTYGHDASIEAVRQPADGDRVRVAFVNDSALDDAGVRSGLRKIDIPELDKFWIPQEVVLISSDFKPQRQLVKDIFIPSAPPAGGYIALDDWVEQYQKGVVTWLREVDWKSEVFGTRYVALQQILDKVRSYENNHPGGARLALVLSGGGAKCAYQTGVIEAIESELNSSNKRTGDMYMAAESENGGAAGDPGKPAKPKPRPLDINLVVGTSGGAINALGVALGLTRNEDGREALKDVWLSFKQQDFFRPWSPMPVTLGLFVGLAQGLILILGLRLHDDEPINWGKWTRPSVIALSALSLILMFSPWRFWASLPLIAMLVLIGVQLYENQAEKWRGLTCVSLLIVGVAELVVAKLELTPWAYMRYVVPVMIFIVLGFTMILATRVLTLDGPGWRKFARIVVPTVTAVEVVILLIWKAPVTWLTEVSKHHVVHHLWMALSMNLVLSALFLIGLGLLMLAAEMYLRGKERSAAEPADAENTAGARGRRPTVERLTRGLKALAVRNANFFGRRRPILSALIIALVSLVAMQIVRTFFLDKSLSMSEGVDRAFVEKLPVLLQHHPNLRTLIKPQGTGDAQRLEDISNQILTRQLFNRDLVITSSLLTNDDQLPDLYFYYQHSTLTANQPPDKMFPPDRRFRSFQEAGVAPRLLDVVIGSATIYPVFGPRHLTIPSSLDGLRRSAGLDIIDGGFAHNSPIEAAVKWGATHIILIEASPKSKPSLHRNLLDNSLDAFNYLFNEAQLVDAHSRGKIEIFSIRPDVDDSKTDANLCTFDFDDSLMKGAIDKGLTDALNTDRPKFLRERGEPVF